MVLAIDEFLYLAKADRSISPILQLAIDANKDRPKLFFAPYGLFLSFVKEQLFDRASPLCGREWRELGCGRLSFDFTDLGRWRGNDPQERSEAEIDVVAVDGGRTVAVGECKWRKRACRPCYDECFHGRARTPALRTSRFRPARAVSS